jgi:DNA-binding NarL/FixJ family response regulator
MPDQVNIMLADDHALMREGLKQIIQLQDEFKVVAEAGTGEELFTQLELHQVDILLLDMSMPGMSGEEMIAGVTQRWPQLPILVVSMFNEPQIATAAIRKGALGFITKDQDPETLLFAIERVAQKQHYIEPSLAEAMLFAPEPPPQQPDLSTRYHSLSQREKQVMQLITEGLTINAIAERLAISNKTVSTHKARLMEKMQFTSNAELIKFVLNFPPEKAP